MPKVSIVILNWNGVKDTLECLESCFKIDYPNFEVIVVDNASLDGSLEKIKEKFPQVTLLQNSQNLGYAEGNNVGMRYAVTRGADYFWLLNNDTTVEVGALKMLVEVMESVPSVGLASPVIYSYDNQDKLQFCGSCFSWEDHMVHNFKDLDELLLFKGDEISLWGTALLIKRSVVEKLAC